MLCSGCGNPFAIAIRRMYVTVESGEKVPIEKCDKCGALKVEAMPDVSDVHEPYFDEHLANKVHPNGQWVNSRRDKANKLKELGLREKRESTIKYIKDVKARQRYFRDQFGG